VLVCKVLSPQTLRGVIVVLLCITHHMEALTGASAGAASRGSTRAKTAVFAAALAEPIPGKLLVLNSVSVCTSSPVFATPRAFYKAGACTKLRRGDAPFFSGLGIRHLVVSSQPPLVCGAAAWPRPGRAAPSVLGAPPNMCHLLQFLGGLIAGGGLLVCSFLLSSVVLVQCAVWCCSAVLVVIATATERSLLLSCSSSLLSLPACCKAMSDEGRFRGHAPCGSTQ
jgi:hypothetical protein